MLGSNKLIRNESYLPNIQKKKIHTFPWCRPIPANAKRVKSVAATTLLKLAQQIN